MAEFKPGDVVKVKSGGPAMTVERITSNQVVCQWFVGADLKGGVFAPEALEPAGKVPSYRVATTRKGL